MSEKGKTRRRRRRRVLAGSMTRRQKFRRIRAGLAKIGYELAYDVPIFHVCRSCNRFIGSASPLMIVPTLSRARQRV